MISSSKNSFIVAFAEELQRARLFSRVTIDEIVTTSRISRPLVEALESGRWDEIPQPYLRGFLAQYALAAGMNVEKVLLGFDRLMSSSGEDESAVLDSSAPLLKQPEYIGVTRAKIRTGWFTALSQNRRFAYAVSAVTIALLGAALFISRSAQRPRVIPAPFGVSVSEYREQTVGPVTRIDLSTSDGPASLGRAKPLETTVVATDTGSILIPHFSTARVSVRFRPYDTLLIIYDTVTYVAVTPAQAARVSSGTTDSLSSLRVSGDTAFYALGEAKPAAMLGVQRTSGDSLIR